MEWRQLTSFAAFSFCCLVAIQAKIVYINGTEVFKEKLNNQSTTTKAPLQPWFSVFNPKNISNHSGYLTSVHRKSDAEEKVTRNDEEIHHQQDVSRNETVATSE
ncbi:uncharacterized protein CEXT_344121 [Caerostris extrusa]|uniref:Secreted protein n=1 Tax=Caerostris extrusa TaxID=172846 RepID=A0AAV4Y803_CAEEX|nr:uncharacterized protein CEXT_344121 [Caerostris extrusa]